MKPLSRREAWLFGIAGVVLVVVAILFFMSPIEVRIKIQLGEEQTNVERVER